jgi:hypothetical protein
LSTCALLRFGALAIDVPQVVHRENTFFKALSQNIKQRSSVIIDEVNG